jgi:NAD(P)-dependent dehydrogenase (short-subunit alcohol dehydrogenase family)
MLSFNFEEQVAFVSGASFGIGRETALRFARAGAKLALIDWAESPGEALAAEIREMGVDARFFKVDVSKENEVQQAIRQIESIWGRLDFAFNNAGIEGQPAPTDQCRLENWNQTIAINLTGTWFAMKSQIPLMRKKHFGVIVNCASVAGLQGIAFMPAYVASKHAVVGLTKVAALELAREGIRVNVVCPGAINTPMLDRFMASSPNAKTNLENSSPIGRVGQPREIADTVLWLCSEGGSFVIGQSIAVDGGWTVP